MDITNTIAALEQERSKLLERLKEIDQRLEKGSCRTKYNSRTENASS